MTDHPQHGSGAKLDGPPLLMVIVFGCVAVLTPYLLAGDGQTPACAEGRP